MRPPTPYDQISASVAPEDTMTRWIPAAVAATTLASANPVCAQGLEELRKLYDSGQYQQVVGAPADDPRVLFLVARSQQKLSHRDEARQAYEQLAARGENDPWHGIGQSAAALLGGNVGEAVEAA